MGEFFKGWRRKVGCITLVFTILAATAWFRSYVLFDGLYFGIGKTQHALNLMSGTLYWSRWYESAPRNCWESNDLLVNMPQLASQIQTQTPDSTMVGGIDVRFPCHVMVLGMTALSAYLLLWKPRKREPQPKQV